MEARMNMIADVAAFMQAGEQKNDAAQVCRQIGFALEEICEGLAALGDDNAVERMEILGRYYKKAPVEAVESVSAADQAELADSMLDTVWVCLGALIAMRVDVPGAWKEIVRSNMSKMDPATGKMFKNAEGKVTKPEWFSPPNLAQYLK